MSGEGGRSRRWVRAPESFAALEPTHYRVPRPQVRDPPAASSTGRSRNRSYDEAEMARDFFLSSPRQPPRPSAPPATPPRPPRHAPGLSRSFPSIAQPTEPWTLPSFNTEFLLRSTDSPTPTQRPSTPSTAAAGPPGLSAARVLGRNVTLPSESDDDSRDGEGKRRWRWYLWLCCLLLLLLLAVCGVVGYLLYHAAHRKTFYASMEGELIDDRRPWTNALLDPRTDAYRSLKAEATEEITAALNETYTVEVVLDGKRAFYADPPFQHYYENEKMVRLRRSATPRHVKVFFALHFTGEQRPVSEDDVQRKLETTWSGVKVGNASVEWSARTTAAPPGTIERARLSLLDETSYALPSPFAQLQRSRAEYTRELEEAFSSNEPSVEASVVVEGLERLAAGSTRVTLAAAFQSADLGRRPVSKEEIADALLRYADASGYVWRHINFLSTSATSTTTASPSTSSTTSPTSTSTTTPTTSTSTTTPASTSSTTTSTTTSPAASSSTTTSSPSTSSTTTKPTTSTTTTTGSSSTSTTSPKTSTSSTTSTPTTSTSSTISPTTSTTTTSPTTSTSTTTTTGTPMTSSSTSTSTTSLTSSTSTTTPTSSSSTTSKSTTTTGAPSTTTTSGSTTTSPVTTSTTTPASTSTSTTNPTTSTTTTGTTSTTTPASTSTSTTNPTTSTTTTGTTSTTTTSPTSSTSTTTTGSPSSSSTTSTGSTSTTTAGTTSTSTTTPSPTSSTSTTTTGSPSSSSTTSTGSTSTTTAGTMSTSTTTPSPTSSTSTTTTGSPSSSSTTSTGSTSTTTAGTTSSSTTSPTSSSSTTTSTPTTSSTTTTATPSTSSTSTTVTPSTSSSSTTTSPATSSTTTSPTTSSTTTSPLSSTTTTPTTSSTTASPTTSSTTTSPSSSSTTTTPTTSSTTTSTTSSPTTSSSTTTNPSTTTTSTTSPSSTSTTTTGSTSTSTVSPTTTTTGPTTLSTKCRRVSQGEQPMSLVLRRQVDGRWVKEKERSRWAGWSGKADGLEEMEESSDVELPSLGGARGSPGLPAVDYILVFDPLAEAGPRAARAAFEREVRRAGLKMEVEKGSAHRSFLKLFAPFDRLCHEAEQVQLEMDLANCPIDQEPPGLWQRLMGRFETDADEVDFVSGPFEVGKLELFEGHDEELSFFRSSLRSLLVHHILESLSCDDVPPTANGRPQGAKSRGGGRPETAVPDPAKRLGLAQLLIKGVYQDAFILHDQSIEDPHYLRLRQRQPEQYQAVVATFSKFDDPRKELKDSWTKFTKFQPLWKIRNYFGEKIALYFAWQGLLLTFLWIPAFAGLAIFFFGIVVSAQESVDTFQNCKCLQLNSSTNFTLAFGASLEKLKKNNTFLKEYCLEKGALDIMSQDMLGVIKKSFNNDLSPSFSLIMCLWGILFLTFWKRKNATVAYEWDCNNFEDTEPDRAEFVGTDLVVDPITRDYIHIFPGQKRFGRVLLSTIFIVSMMLLVFLTIAGSIVIKVVLRARWKCPPEEQVDLLFCDPENDHPLLCLFGGVILPSSIMAVSVMVWGRLYAVVAKKLTEHENWQTQSDFQDALIIKLFAFEFVNHYAILFYLAVFRPQKHYTQPEGMFGMGVEYSDTCPEGRCMATLSFQVLLLMIIKPVIKFGQDIILPWGLRRLKQVLSAFRMKKAALKVEDAARQVVDGEGGADWKGAPGLADKPASKSYIEREYRKPPPGDFSLEEFTEKTMQFGYVVMFTAAFPLAPFLALVVNAVDLRVDARRLLWFNRRPLAFISSDIGMWEAIMAFLNFCGVVTNGFLLATTSEFSANNDTNERLWTFVVFEHMVFTAMFIIRVLIPNTPAKVKLATRREKIQVAKILADGYIPRSESALSRAPSVVGPRRAPSCTLSVDQDLARLENRHRDHHKPSTKRRGRRSRKSPGAGGDGSSTWATPRREPAREALPGTLDDSPPSSVPASQHTDTTSLS